MARKYSLLTLVLVIWFVEACLGHRHKPHLTTRSSIYDTTLQPSFLRFPHSTCDDGIEDYEQVRLEEDSNQPWDLYCLCDDPRWCLIFDLKGLLAGVLVSYIAAEIQHFHPHTYNFSSSNFIDKIIYGTPVKSVPFFFTNPEELTEEGRNSSSREMIDGLWAYIDGDWLKFDSKCEPNSPVIGDHFYRQGCGPKLGIAYVRLLFHEKCNNDFFIFLLYEKEKLVGFGHGIPGIVSPGPKKNVYFYPRGHVLRQIMANPSPCFWETVSSGITAVGVFFNEDPWNIRCPKCLCN